MSVENDPIAALELDPDGPPIFAAIVGRKGSGKSEFLKSYARSWPYDALLIDPTKDLDPNYEWSRPWPGGDDWPEHLEDDPVKHHRYRMSPDRLKDPDHREKVDRAVQLAHLNPEPTFIGIDEGRYLFASDEKILPGSDIVQNEGRHGADFLFVANPRAVGIRPIFWAQADWIVMFALDGPDDIKRAAEGSGLSVAELTGLQESLEREPLGARGEIVTGFILIDKPRQTVGVYPILPL